MNINSIFIRLRLFIISPAFPVILVSGTIFFLVFIVYSSPVMLCDDNSWTLYQLKSELTSELARYRISLINIDQYSDLQEQLYQISRPNFRNFKLEEHYANMHQCAVQECNQSMTTISKLENSIKRIEPGFKLPIGNINYYGRIGKGV